MDHNGHFVSRMLQAKTMQITGTFQSYIFFSFFLRGITHSLQNLTQCWFW